MVSKPEPPLTECVAQLAGKQMIIAPVTIDEVKIVFIADKDVGFFGAFDDTHMPVPPCRDRCDAIISSASVRYFATTNPVPQISANVLARSSRMLQRYDKCLETDLPSI